MRAASLAAILALTTASAAPAQDVALRLGGFRSTYADSLSGSAPSLGAEAVFRRGARFASASASLATFSQGTWAAQASLNGVVTLADSPRRSFGLAFDAAGFAFSGNSGTGNVTAGPQVATRLGPLVAAAAAAAGAVRRIDGTGGLLATGTLRLRRESDRWSAEGWTSLSQAGSRRYGDVGANLRFDSRRFSADLQGGRRAGDLGNVFWGQVRAAVALGGPVWLEAGAGRYPPDVTGFLHGSFVHAGLRVGLGRRARTAADEPALVRREGGDAVTVRFALRDTGAVAVAGEWDGWAVTPLGTDSTGRRILRARLAPGVYRFALVGADGRFFVPRGVASVPDDFGGEVGLLVVPE